MTDYQKYINALRKCAKEHENDTTYTGHIIVSNLCQDTANLLEELEQELSGDDVVSHDVLDKIIAEIKQRPYGVANDSVIQGMKYERVANLEILGKYKAETEK